MSKYRVECGAVGCVVVTDDERLGEYECADRLNELEAEVERLRADLITSYGQCQDARDEWLDRAAAAMKGATTDPSGDWCGCQCCMNCLYAVLGLKG